MSGVASNEEYFLHKVAIKVLNHPLHPATIPGRARARSRSSPTLEINVIAVEKNGP